MPFEGGSAFCALVKGLIYSEDVLDYVQMCIREKGLNEDSIRDTEASLMKNGWDGVVYGQSAREFLKETLDMCEKNLTAEEGVMLRGWQWEG